MQSSVREQQEQLLQLHMSLQTAEAYVGFTSGDVGGARMRAYVGLWKVMLDFAATTVVLPRFSALRMQARRISVPSSPRHVRIPVRHSIASLRSVAVTVA